MHRRLRRDPSTVASTTWLRIQTYDFFNPIALAVALRFDVADGDVPNRDSQISGDLQRFTGQRDFGLTAGFFDHFDIGPGNSAAPAGTEHFQHGFFGGESSG